MGFKDSCRNTEKNAILRGHKQGISVQDISKRLRLTERIVQEIIDYYAESESESESKPKKKAKKKTKKKAKPADDFDD